MVNVTVTEGSLRGGKSKTDKGFEYYEFLGIPYARPPMGDLRFKSPQPPMSWKHERNATIVNPENIAVQVNLMTGAVSGSEDCLYLNVYTPKLLKDGSELLPVVVYIHGGGFIGGNGIIKSENGPDNLVEQNVVVVSINYRLGVFGFLSLDISEAAGNMGLKDQIKALEWIKSNIENFCGDRNNVTLFGMSAGSASIEYHILSPAAKGLFHKAVMRSGSALNHWAINYKVNQLSLKVAALLGYKGSHEDRHAVHKFLLTIPAIELAGAAFQWGESCVTNRVFFAFVPTVEKNFGDGNAVLTSNPYRLFKEGNFNKVPVMKGFCNRQDALMSMMKPIAMKALIDNKRFTDHWSYKLDSNDIENLNKQFSAAYMDHINAEDEDNKNIAVDFFGDLDFVSGIWIAGKLLSSKVPVYMYEFCYDGKLNTFKYLFGLMKKGALHGDDFSYIFNNDLIKTDNEQDIAVRDRTTKMLTNFAKTGDPGTNWPVFTESSQAYLYEDKDSTIKSNYEAEKIEIFERMYEKYGK